MAAISLKNINKLAIPAIIAGITEPVISITDTAIAGQIDSVSLAAVGLGSSFFSFMLWVLSAFRHAISSIVSTHLGKNKLEEIASLLPQAILFNFLIGIVIAFITGNFAREIFVLYKADGAILRETISYFQIRCLGFPVIFSVFVIFGIFRGFQNTLWAMYIAFAGMMLNVLLSFLLAYGVDGIIPAYGLAGIARASVISQLFMLALSLLFVFLKVRRYFRIDFRPNRHFSQLMGMGGNLIIRTIALNLTFYFGNRFANLYGDAYIACHTIFVNIWLFAAFFVDGYSNAANAIGGKLYGAGDYLTLYRLGRKIGGIVLLIALGIALAYTMGYIHLPRLFTHDEQVRSLFYQVFWLIILSQPINAIAFMLDGIYKGIGNTRLLRNSQLAATFLGYIPAIYLFDYLDMELYGIWLAFLVWMLARAGILGIHFYFTFGKR